MYKKTYFILIIMLLILVSIGCVEEELNKDHIINNEDISAYIIIQPKTSLVYNFEDKLEETTTFNMYLNIYSKNYLQSEINYELNAVNVLGEETEYKSKNEVSLPMTKLLLFNTNVGGNGFQEFFLKINSGEDHLFYEEFMNISYKEIKGYTDKFSNDIIYLDIDYTEDDEKYNFTVSFNSTEDIHIDFQSYLVSKEANIYAFLGMYGYQANVFPYYIENNYIYKEMGMVYLMFKLTFYQLDGNKTEIKAMYLIEDILK